VANLDLTHEPIIDYCFAWHQWQWCDFLLRLLRAPTINSWRDE